MTTQTGPRLTITGTCEGCCHLRAERIHRGNLMPAWCAAVAAKGIADGGKVTPAWCPELPAARLALARAVVAAEAPCQVSLVRQIGCNLPCIVKGEHAEHRSACGRRWGGEGFADHPDFDSRAFCDDGSEAQ